MRAPADTALRFALLCAATAGAIAAGELGAVRLGATWLGSALWGASLGLLAGALGLAARVLDAQRTARVFAVATFAVGAAHLVDYLLAWIAGVGPLFGRATGPLSPGMALALALFATALALAEPGPSQRVRSVGTGALGGAVTVLGLAILAGYFLDPHSEYGVGIARTPPFQSFAAIVLGLGVVLLAWRSNAADRQRYGLAISGTTALGLLISVLLALVLLAEESRAQRRLARSELERLTHTLGVVTEVHTIAVDRMADRWNREDGDPLWRWRADAENHLAQATAFTAFGWIGPHGQSEWATGRRPAPEADAPALQALRRQALEAGATRLVDSFPEPGQVAAVAPLEDGGALFAILDVHALSDLSWGGAQTGFRFALADAAGVRVASATPPHRGAERGVLPLRGTEWTVSVSIIPTGAVGAVPAFTFIAGIALTVLSGSSMALRRTALERAQALEAVSNELEANASQLLHTNQELLRSNEELGRFATLASHDLQEPLRQITSLSDRLEEKHAASLDENGRTYLEFISEAAQRARLMIEDLLRYARVDGQAQQLSAVSADEALGAALDQLRSRIEESEARIDADPLPVVRANSSLLVQLFANLVGNAIKYRSEESPRIHVGVRDAGAAWVFSVRDNGIGIDPAYHERIFEIFERLPANGDDREVPGTGVGLAVCKKVVERLGGEISVDSAPGRGSTFRFSLPKPGC